MRVWACVCVCVCVVAKARVFYFKFLDYAAFHFEYCKLLEFYVMSTDKYRIFEG